MHSVRRARCALPGSRAVRWGDRACIGSGRCRCRCCAGPPSALFCATQRQPQRCWERAGARGARAHPGYAAGISARGSGGPIPTLTGGSGRLGGRRLRPHGFHGGGSEQVSVSRRKLLRGVTICHVTTAHPRRPPIFLTCMQPNAPKLSTQHLRHGPRVHLSIGLHRQSPTLTQLLHSYFGPCRGRLCSSQRR